MAPEQQEFPSNPMKQDLYSQISASDVRRNNKKPKQSFVMALMVDVMRFTLFIDEKRRKYQKFFSVLSQIWVSFMVMLYTSSFVMLGIFVYSYIQFPTLIQDYFSSNGVLFEKMEIPGYIVSSVKLNGLHDKDNLYRIETLTVNSNFSDFLQGRVKSVVLEGIQLRLEKEGPSPISKTIIPLLMHLNEKSKTNLNIRVDSLEIKDAVLTVKGRDFELPIHFSLTGIYGKETSMSAYLMVNKPNLAFQGPLVIKGDKAGITFSLDVHAGHVRIPGRMAESLTGKMSLVARNEGVQSFQGQINLFQNQQEKVLKLNLMQDKNKLFKGILDLSWLNVLDGNTRDEVANLSLNMTGLVFNKKGEITTEDPISVSFKGKKSKFKIGRLITELKGKLDCLMLERCVYHLNENARVLINQLEFPYQSDLIKGVKESVVSVQKSPNLFLFPFRDRKIFFDVNIGNSFFSGRQEVSTDSVSFRSGPGKIQGEWNLSANLVQSMLDIKQVNYQTPNYSISNAQLKIDNVFDPKKRIKVSSSQVLIRNNPLFKKAFSIDYETNNGMDRVSISFPKEKIHLLMNGDIDLITGYVNAQFSLPPIELKNIGNNPSEFSDIFPKNIQKISGQVAAEGLLIGSLSGGLQGPFNLGFENVSITTDRMTVDGLNTALRIQTLKPFITASKQPIFIKRMTSIIPFDNVIATFKIDNQFLRVDELSTLIAGVPFQLNSTIIPYHDINTLLYLHQKGTNMSGVSKGLKIPNWEMKPPFEGRSSLVLSVKDRKLTVDRASVKIDNGEILYKGKKVAKPKELASGSNAHIQSGSIVFEWDEDNKEMVSLNLNLDTIVPSTKKHWLIQKTEKMSILPFFAAPTEQFSVPRVISLPVHSIFQRSELAME